MADQSFFGPFTILAGVAILVFAPAFLILHVRFKGKQRAQMEEFSKLRAGVQ